MAWRLLRCYRRQAPRTPRRAKVSPEHVRVLRLSGIRRRPAMKGLRTSRLSASSIGNPARGVLALSVAVRYLIITSVCVVALTIRFALGAFLPRLYQRRPKVADDPPRSWQRLPLLVRMLRWWSRPPNGPN